MYTAITLYIYETVIYIYTQLYASTIICIHKYPAGPETVPIKRAV